MSRFLLPPKLAKTVLDSSGLSPFYTGELRLRLCKELLSELLFESLGLTFIYGDICTYGLFLLLFFGLLYFLTVADPSTGYVKVCPSLIVSCIFCTLTCSLRKFWYESKSATNCFFCSPFWRLSLREELDSESNSTW